MMTSVFKDILKNLQRGDASDLTSEVIYNINQITLNLMYAEQTYQRRLTPTEIEIMGDILHISNIIYNNTDRSILVLEDGVYDLLLEKYKMYNPNFQVGAEPIHFGSGVSGDVAIVENDSNMSPFITVDPINKEEMLFFNELNKTDDMTMVNFGEEDKRISKRIRNSSHKYPSLVGTLDKDKFVLNSEAMEKGVFDDPTVKIFERDFLRDHVEKGIVNPNNITLVLELKYDGVSVEAEVTDRVLSARTRGDTGIDKASDVTPIFRGYPFRNAMGYKIEPFGMKFEAIINKYNLQLLCKETGKYYRNPRNAIIGILGNSNASQYSKYITLVPLATSHSNMNRIEELEFMNKYYSTGEFCRYAVVSGDYNSVLFQVKRFVDEAEKMRDYLPFMYDGIVVSYLDPTIRNFLGRKNFINKYSVAIKFNTKKKLTRIRSVSFTVGANGDITPMYYYDPVEFYGNIQTKSSGHSYGRFVENNLRPGDIIECEYRNDVMNYVTRAHIEDNLYNPNPPFQFPTHCPECGSPIQISKTFENAVCTNMNCAGRVTARITNMIAKLGFKGFSTETVKKLQIQSFYDLMNMTEERASILGDVNCDNLMTAIYEFLRTPIVDYNVLGSLGFTGLAATKWKKILSTVSLKDIVTLDGPTLMCVLSSTKGIGDVTAGVVVKERDFYMRDLLFIYNKMPNIIFTKGDNDQALGFRKTIRFSGVRDPELMMTLCNIGHDCSEGSVTKKTDFLIIPYLGFESTKTKTAEKYRADGSNIKIIPLNEFKLNQDTYLGEI